MNILFTHPKPARISYKHMSALSQVKGINVYLLYGRLSSDVLEEDIENICKGYRAGLPLTRFPYYYKTYRKTIKKYVDQWNIDVIQTYSEPDDVAVASIESRSAPVVFCNRDNVSAYSKELLATRIVPRWMAYNRYLGLLPRELLYKYVVSLERKAHEKSDARMYISPGMLEYSSKMYNIGENNLIFTDWVLDGEIPETPKKKLSEDDGEIHIGFSGAIVISDNYRNHLPFLAKLAGEGIHIHMHIVTHDKESWLACKEAVKRNKYLHLYDSLLPAKEFIEQLTAYDWGIIPFESELKYVNTILTNKIYDYISARVPVISSDTKSLKKYIAEKNLGFIYKDLSDLLVKLERKEASQYKIEPSKFLISSHIEKIISFYEKIGGEKD